MCFICDCPSLPFCAVVRGVQFECSSIETRRQLTTSLRMFRKAAQQALKREDGSWMVLRGSFACPSCHPCVPADSRVLPMPPPIKGNRHTRARGSSRNASQDRRGIPRRASGRHLQVWGEGGNNQLLKFSVILSVNELSDNVHLALCVISQKCTQDAVRLPDLRVEDASASPR